MTISRRSGFARIRKLKEQTEEFLDVIDSKKVNEYSAKDRISSKFTSI